MAKESAPQGDLEEDDLLVEIRGRFRDARDHASKWREEARECYRFYAGHQWSEDDLAKLEEQQRPAITFNRAGVLIDAVLGHEENNKTEVRYIPRTPGDSQVNEKITSVSQFFRDLCDASDEESDAFRDALVTGMGWTNTRLDDEQNPDYDLIEERIDPLEMLWDPASRKPNLADGRYIFRHKKMSPVEIRSIWPDWNGIDYDDEMAWEDDHPEPGDANPRNSYKDRAGEHDDEKGVSVIEYQYRDIEPFYVIQMPLDEVGPDGLPFEMIEQPADEMDDEKLAKLDEQGIKYAHKRRIIHKRCFVIGNEIVQEDQPYPKGFTYACITGKRDQEKGHWFGLMRALMDPQRWSNKWLSQILNIVNSQAKGGVMVEKWAIANQSEFEAKWADPQSIATFTEGALSKGAVQPKPMGQYPAAIDRLLEYANQSFGDVSGVNQELLGMADREQPGVLEWQRKQSAVTLLAPIFASLSRFRKIQGRTWLYFMYRYVSDGRVVRITQDDNDQNVPIDKSWFDGDIATYDVVVDQAATAPNQKEATWAVLNNLLPLLKDAMGPDELMLMLEYSPLPPSFVDKLKQIAAEKAAQPPAPDPEMIKAENQVKIEQTKTESAIQLKQIELQADLQIEREKAAQQLQLKEAEAKINMLMKLAEGSQNAIGAGADGVPTDGPIEGSAPRPQTTPPVDMAALLSSMGGGGNQELAGAIREIGGALIEALNRPKQVVRGPDGRAMGVQ